MTDRINPTDLEPIADNESFALASGYVDYNGQPIHLLTLTPHPKVELNKDNFISQALEIISEVLSDIDSFARVPDNSSAPDRVQGRILVIADLRNHRVPAVAGTVHQIIRAQAWDTIRQSLGELYFLEIYSHESLTIGGILATSTLARFARNSFSAVKVDSSIPLEQAIEIGLDSLRPAEA